MPVLIPGLITTGGVAGGAVGAFPDVPLQLTCQAAFGADLTADPDTWTWTDLTCTHPSNPAQTISRLTNAPITQRRGVVVGAGTSQTTSASLQLFNHDGAWTPHLPTSPHFPYIDAGTPIRVQLTYETGMADTFGRTVASGWGTASDGTVWSASNPAPLSVNGSTGRVSHATANTIYGVISDHACADADLRFDVQAPAVTTGAALHVGPNLRWDQTTGNSLWTHVEFLTSGNVRVGIFRYVANAPTSVAATTVAGLTYTGTVVIRCRVLLEGTRVRMKAWNATDPEPATWTIDQAETVVTARAPVGFLSWRPAANSNTSPVVLAVDNLTVDPIVHDWLEGYVADIKPTFEPLAGGQTWSTVTVDVGGVGTRLEKRQSPAWSPLRRSVQLAPTTPIGYWPLEDGQGSTVGVSAFPAGPKMIPVGPAVFGFDAGIPEEQYLTRFGTKPLVSVAAGARLQAPVPRSTINTEWAVTVVAQLYAPLVPTTEIRMLEWTTTGTHNRWALVQTGAGYEVRAYNDAADTITTVVTEPEGPYAQQVVYTVEAKQNGANTDIKLFFNSFAFGTGTGSVAGTLGAVTSIAVNPDRVNTTASTSPFGIKWVAGHVMVTDDVNIRDLPFYGDVVTGKTVRADQAWFTESAHRRLQRLCEEERVPFTLVEDPAATGVTLLNAQRDGAFTDLVTQAAESESGGLLFEAGFGYAYLPRSCRYNRPAALTIDMAAYKRSGDTGQADVLVPALDVRGTNYWTVERHGGAEGTYAAPEVFRLRRGTIAEKITLDVYSDADTDQHAAWRTNLTYNAQDAHYPNVPVDLHANPELIDGWVWVRVGDRIVRTNQPSIAGIGVIDQTVDGITETISPTTWTAQVNASPGKVWDVAVVGDATMGKAGTDGSTFRAATSTATSLLIDVVEGPRWTTDGAQMPIYVTAATGEDIRIDAISGTSNPQTATVVRSLNGLVKAIPADTPFQLTHPARAAL